MKKLTLMMLPDFLKQAESLSKEIKTKLVKIMRLMSEDIRHPGLQARKVKSSTVPLYECRVDKDIRLIYDMKDDALRCWYIGEHDAALRFAASGISKDGIIIDDIEICEIEEVPLPQQISRGDMAMDFIIMDIEAFINAIS